jgi:hypothetical protein
MQDITLKEEQLELLIQNGKTEEAVQCLYDLIIAYAKRKEFAKAESLRDRLYEVDPLAIREIVKTGDIIEQEKSQTLDQDHMQLWFRLYNGLSQEEINELYYALTTRRFDVDSVLFTEGEPNQNLYLIERGDLKLSFRHDDRDVHLKALGSGEMVGGETFFSRTAYATFSASPITPVQASVLDRSVLPGWQKDFRGLLTRILEHWFHGYDIPEKVKTLNVDRRRQERVPVKAPIGVQVLDSAGNPSSKPFRGRLKDISTGGLAFGIETRKADAARVLLSRRIALKCKLPMSEGDTELKKLGRIVAVRDLPFDEFSFHVRFDKPISRGLMNDLGT